MLLCAVWLLFMHAISLSEIPGQLKCDEIHREHMHIISAKRQKFKKIRIFIKNY